jgi:hypothetical protein
MTLKETRRQLAEAKAQLKIARLSLEIRADIIRNLIFLEVKRLKAEKQK